jgi:alpha-tubulin suppressor-like RCC1 family protein
MLKCWGENSDGRVGNAATTMDFVFPYGVADLSSASVDVAAGGEHTCVLLDTDSVQCFGENYWGELGDGTNTDATAPVTVLGLAAGTITSIDTGSHHSCALFSSISSVKCWGYNAYGQLGDGSQTDSSTPVSVTGL